LDVAEACSLALEILDLALADQRVDGLDLDAEQALDGRLDLRLRGIRSDIEDNLVLLGDQSAFFGDCRTADDVEEVFPAHLNRASSASTAAFVSTSFLWRSTS